ncbi:hypothetical protein [Pseudoalteromonas sp. Z9A5]|uniref:hypothetical protein n=1 Tax=Pseudoalteromonas sp. Z9A5 TaxID=2686355 RepID=UPI0014082D9C|nr:hypothetical protein [Pseudoalteromonas sp. Z9A5]
MEANILTVLAVLVAGFTLLSEEKRIDLKLRISKIDIFGLAIIFISILYMVYLPLLKEISLIIPLPWLPGFDANLATFSFIFIIICYFLIKVNGTKLPKTRINSWSLTSEQLLRTHKFDQLSFLLNKYHAQFLKADNENSLEKIRLKLLKASNPPSQDLLGKLKQLQAKRGNSNGQSDVKSKPEINLKDKVKQAIAKNLLTFLPKTRRYRNEARESLSKLLKSKPFVQHLTISYPLLCAKFTTSRFNGDEEFTTNYLTELISNQQSSLYRELKDNQNCSYTGEYYIDESNQLLSFYFMDIKTASDTSIWKPVGDYTTNFIKKQRGTNNFYNSSYDYSYEDDKWQCPIYITICLFKVMVSKAIFDRHQDHMWLMYIEFFIDEILANYEPKPLIDLEREFPTHFDFLIYFAISTCCDWARTPVYLTNINNVAESDKKGYPEYWASKTLGQILRKVILSSKQTDTQCIYYLEMVVRLVNELDQSNHKDYSKLIMNALLKQYDYSQPDKLFVTKLENYYQQIDHVLRKSSSTFATLLKQAKVGKMM